MDFIFQADGVWIPDLIQADLWMDEMFFARSWEMYNNEKKRDNP
jgi:hypothetical protein